ncbi:hypothetical protein I317_05603 [Kwoniella heveanensis CBS 569]|uniref:Uncharacterized protein n=1 Tax=Kwoniella heveanensis BCC8398 TaxID=1296120 RepID=A0A1B9GMR6_9TREE|nr:hypothetical protein I316_05829 [Kwoniella heveanensis BCC8398]OCF40593.1 hypothetical protein I317_05603 [Kwoniella heveanensis CBS 569]
MPPKTYLLSRTLDPLLGIFTGILAFHLNETNPRSAPAEGHTLRELVSWKWSESRRLREIRDRQHDADAALATALEGGAGEGEWERVTKEFVGAAATPTPVGGGVGEGKEAAVRK